MFGIQAAVFLASILLMTLAIDKLQPHYSYLIEKQKEMMAANEGKAIIGQRDIRLLMTPEY